MVLEWDLGLSSRKSGTRLVWKFTHTHNLLDQHQNFGNVKNTRLPTVVQSSYWGVIFCSYHHIFGRNVHKFTLFTSWRHVREAEVWVHAFSCLAVEGVSVQFCALVCLPQGKKPGAHWLGVLVGPITSLNILEVREILASAEILTLDYTVCSFITITTTLSKLLPCHRGVTKSNQSLSFA